MMIPQIVVGQAASGTEGGRRPTGVTEAAGAPADTEVVARTSRRRLTVSYKLKVLDTVQSLRERGQGAVGGYLRKEGLYYSAVRKWDRQRSQGLLTASGGGRHEKSRDTLLAENKQLRRRLEQIQKRLEKTELIVDLQKKLSTFMENQDSYVRSVAG